MSKLEIQIPEAARQAAREDERIVELRVFPDGWVPNAYKWPAPGRRVVLKPAAPETGFTREDSVWQIERVDDIDRKRSRGEGPYWVAVSEKGGRLASG